MKTKEEIKSEIVGINWVICNFDHSEKCYSESKQRISELEEELNEIESFEDIKTYEYNLGYDDCFNQIHQRNYKQLELAFYAGRDNFQKDWLDGGGIIHKYKDFEDYLISEPKE